MATLEKIRQRSKLVIILIGLAIAAFTLTDLLSSGKSAFGGNDDTVMEVNGEKISRVVFSEKLTDRTEQYKQQMNDPSLSKVTTKQLVDATYDEILRAEIMKEYADKGFMVTSEELSYRIMNNPNIRQTQAFIDPNTRQFSEDMFNRQLASLREAKDESQQNSDQWAQWISFESSVKEQGLQNKVYAAARKGIYMPTKMAEYQYKVNNSTRSASFVFLPYTDVEDSEVEVTDADIKNYVSNHSSDFKQEDSRDFQFANFAIRPSVEDYNDVQAQLKDLLNDQVVVNRRTKQNDTLIGFTNTVDDSVFVNANSEYPFDPSIYIPGELPSEIDSIMTQAEEGYIYGPYRSESGFKISKLVEVRNVADSVKSKHILISFQGAQRARETVVRTGMQAKLLADSLLEVLNGDMSLWDSINKTYSDDLVAKAKDGDLGWISRDAQFDPTFKAYVFRAKKGSLGVVYTSFGFHIINLVDAKGENRGMKVGTIYREVTPSEKTLNDIYDQASKFAAQVEGAEDISAVATELGANVRLAKDIKEFDERIPGLGNNRDIVRWTFEEDRSVGDIQLLSNNQESYVVIILTGINEKGLMSVEKARATATPEIMKEKKAEILIQKLKEASASDITSLGANLKQKEVPSSVALSSNSLGAVGSEPLVVGAIGGLELNKLSSPIKGDRGVFVAVVTNVIEPKSVPDQKPIAMQQASQSKNRVISTFVKSLEDEMNVVDRRPFFY